MHRSCLTGGVCLAQYGAVSIVRTPRAVSCCVSRLVCTSPHVSHCTAETAYAVGVSLFAGGKPAPQETNHHCSRRDDEPNFGCVQDARSGLLPCSRSSSAPSIIHAMRHIPATYPGPECAHWGANVRRTLPMRCADLVSRTGPGRSERCSDSCIGESQGTAGEFL